MAKQHRKARVLVIFSVCLLLCEKQLLAACITWTCNYPDIWPSSSLWLRLFASGPLLRNVACLCRLRLLTTDKICHIVGVVWFQNGFWVVANFVMLGWGSDLVAREVHLSAVKNVAFFHALADVGVFRYSCIFKTFHPSSQAVFF